MLDYSIIIPVFNKAAFTKRCLESLRHTLDGAGEGEIIVIDNASTDETATMLEAFPEVRVVRNDRNLGFAGANNQGASLARGRYLVLLNNDTEAHPGWLAHLLRNFAESSVGVVGAKLLFPSNRIQHAGVAVSSAFLSKLNFVAFHINYNLAANDPRANIRRDMEIVTGACLATPRDLYLRLGGLDEAFWNGYEDVDYCLKVGREGLRVVYEPAATLYHFESQSGAQRFRKTIWNAETLRERWPNGTKFDACLRYLQQGEVRRISRTTRGNLEVESLKIPPVTLVVHSATSSDESLAARFIAMTKVPVTDALIVTSTDDRDDVEAAMSVRGLRYVAFVHAQSVVAEGWLEELIRQVETSPLCAAATSSERLPFGENIRALAPDARCTLLALEKFPAHLRLGRFGSWDATIADFCLRALPLAVGTRGVGAKIADLPQCANDSKFFETYGFSLTDLHDDGRIEAMSAPQPVSRGLVSIVTLSWNAPEFTKIALDSIREHTSEPYEVIVVDNGSREETVAMLRAIDDPHVRIIYNATNRGFAGGNNDGIAVARGEHVILLNNDVIVTEGWVDGLLRPFAEVPGVGVSAPRSNRVVGHQQIYDAIYESGDEMHAYAAMRSAKYRGRGYVSDRAIGFCLCISRTVLDEVGGLDESFGAGNFEDDDFCLRVRSAGYKIYVCDDVFIHHFGSQSFVANKVDYAATMQTNWAIFAKKWGYPAAYPVNGYKPSEAIRRGFDSARHFVPIRRSSIAPLVFWARVDDETQWDRVAPFVRRYVRAFTVKDKVELHLTIGPEVDAEIIARRIARAAEKAGLTSDATPDILVTDDEPAHEHREDILSLEDASPSALRRMLETPAL